MAKVHQLSVFRPKRPVKSLKYAFRYNEDDIGLCANDEDAFIENVYQQRDSNVSHNVVDFLQRREHGGHVVRPISFKPEYGTRHILEHSLLEELEIPHQSVNKIFCAKWLSDTQIVFGTKCNKLLVLDLITRKLVQIPSLMSSKQSIPPDVQCGIHSIQINPSSTLLATGGNNANDVAVYRLPTLDPLCIGEGANKDCIFDIIWLDDQFFITGSRDTKISLWHIDDTPAATTNDEEFPMHTTMSPVLVKTCEKAEKVRALSLNLKYQEFVALSLNAYLHIWDLHTFKQKTSRRLPHCLENVCLATRPDCSLYAVGSRSHLTLHESRTLRAVEHVSTKIPNCSIRSISFNNNIITMGTGTGMLMFYDCRARNYLEIPQDLTLDLQRKRSETILPLESKPVVLQASQGWVYPDAMYRDMFQNRDYKPAIYTHCYDPSGTKIFAAGGPLPASLHGNYAALWQ